MNYHKLQAYFFLGILLIAFLLNVFIFLPYVGALLLGATFAIVFQPVHRRILRFVGEREVLAALMTTLLVVVVVLVPLIFFGIQLFNEAHQLYTSVAQSGGGGDFANRLTAFIQDKVNRLFPSAKPIVSGSELAVAINQYARQVLAWIIQNIGPFFSGVARIALGVFISIVTLYYILKDGKKLEHALMAVSPLTDRYDKEILDRLHIVVNAVVKGTLVMALIQGVLASIGFTFFGVPNPVLWGSVTVIAALLPIVGTALVTMPAVLYLTVLGNFIPALGLLVWATVVVSLVDNFLRPKLMERDLHLHPLLILLSVLGGIQFFGPLGFLIGPLVLSLLFAFLHIYQREFKEYINQEN